jgi:hypothetical protein
VSASVAREHANSVGAEPNRAERIRALNDHLRRWSAGGKVMLTRGIASLPTDELLAVTQAVAAFEAFGEDNDPHGEHDFGTLSVRGHEVIWKIDYYDKSMEFGSEDPSEPAVTCRVLTIMLASEF